MSASAPALPGLPPQPGVRVVRRHGAAMPWALRICDAGFLTLVILFSSDAFTFLGVNSLIWLACYGYFFIRISMSLGQFAAAVERNWVFMIYPILAMASVMWSEMPLDGLRFALQLMVSVLMAIFIGTRFSVRQIYLTFFGVMLFAMVVSVLNITSALTPAYDGRNLFKGIFVSKNALGHRAVLFSVTCAFGLLILPGLRPLVRLACLFGLGVVVIVLGVAGSATGILFSFMASAGGLALWLMLRWRGAWAFLLAPVLAAIGLFLIASLFTRLDPLSFMLQLVGRDATLTGRTVLWQFGWEHYIARPWSGLGAAGFWGNPRFAAEILPLQEHYGDGVLGFHNLTIELLVMLGPAGLLAHLALTLVALYRCLWHARHRADPYGAWAFIIVMAIWGMAQLAPQFYQGHAIPLILVVALGTAFRLPQSPRREAPSARISSTRPGASLALDIRGLQ